MLERFASYTIPFMKKLVVGLMLVAPIPILIFYQAFFSPAIEFLRPSATAEWIVLPVPVAEGFYASEYKSPNAFFFREFRTENGSETSSLRITSLGEFTVILNDEELKLSPHSNWKTSTDVPIGPLLNDDTNRLRIVVSNPTGPPALLVEASDDLPRELNTSGSWRVGLTRRRGTAVPAAIATEGEIFLTDRPSPSPTAPYYFLQLALLGAIVLTILYSIAPLAAKPWLKLSTSPGADSPSLFDRSREHWIFALLFGVIAISQIFVALNFDSAKYMPDAISHLDYVKLLEESWRAPLAEEGWQMYHPPLYYFLSALISTAMKQLTSAAIVGPSLQLFSTLAGLGTIVVAGVLITRLLPESTPAARIMGFAIAAFAPIGFYMNPHISNEVFAGFMIASSYLLASVLLFDREQTIKSAFLLGIVGGLGMLSKYTGLFINLSIGALLALRYLSNENGKERRKTLVFALQFVGFVLLVCGWFYVRNYVQYGDPFIGNWDAASGFQYEQPPGYRTLGFYDPTQPFLLQEPERARWQSFLGGMYASFWMDIHNFVLDRGMSSIASLGTLLLWLGLIPTVGIVIGFLLACRFLLREEWDHPLLLLVLGSVWTCSAIVSFTLELPFLSTVNGYFLLSLIPAIGVFAGLGLHWMGQRMGRVRYLLHCNLAVLFCLILYVFLLA